MSRVVEGKMMLYVCEKCGMVYNADYNLIECESCGCTFIRRADEKEVMAIVGDMLLNTDEAILLKEERSVKHHK